LVRPIKELGEPLDGAQCETCSWITINKDEMRKHCKQNHKQAWVGEKSSLYRTVKVQSFFRTRGLQKYFIVSFIDDGDREDAAVESCVQAQLAEYGLTQQESRKSCKHSKRLRRPTRQVGSSAQAGWSSLRTGISLI
jgi:hypothetical protein